MNKVATAIEGLWVLEPKVFGDERGYFFESHNEDTFAKLGLRHRFVQDNESRSRRGTLRGLHFQQGEHAQAKLVRVVSGEVLDVAVDLRPGSATYGRAVTELLTGENKKMMLVPRGFAHGFVVLSAEAVFQYKCDNFYRPDAEGGVRWDDPELAIDWRMGADEVILSAKDRVLPYLRELAR